MGIKTRNDFFFKNFFSKKKMNKSKLKMKCMKDRKVGNLLVQVENVYSTNSQQFELHGIIPDYT